MTLEREPPDRAAELRTGADRVKRVLRPLLAVVAFAFVVWAFRDLALRWESGRVHIDWFWVACSLVPLAVGGVVLAYSWTGLLSRMAGRPVPLGPGLALHTESQMARYLPGKVGIPMVRMAGAKSLGVAPATAGSSVLVELMSFVAVGGLVGSALLAWQSKLLPGLLQSFGRVAPIAVVALSLLLLALMVLDRQRYPGRVLRAMALEGEGPLVPVGLPFLHVLYWLTWAAHGYLVARAVGSGVEPALAGSGLFVVAPIIGFLALVAPAGAGVREAVLSMGLVPALGAAPALGALIVSRGATLIADVVLWVVLRPLRAR